MIEPAALQSKVSGPLPSPWSCLCPGPASALVLPLPWSCLCPGPASALILPLPWSCLCPGPASALVLPLPWACLCPAPAPALVLPLPLPWSCLCPAPASALVLPLPWSVLAHAGSGSPISHYFLTLLPLLLPLSLPFSLFLPSCRRRLHIKCGGPQPRPAGHDAGVLLPQPHPPHPHRRRPGPPLAPCWGDQRRPVLGSCSPDSAHQRRPAIPVEVDSSVFFLSIECLSAQVPYCSSALFHVYLAFTSFSPQCLCCDAGKGSSLWASPWGTHSTARHALEPRPRARAPCPQAPEPRQHRSRGAAPANLRGPQSSLCGGRRRPAFPMSWAWAPSPLGLQSSAPMPARRLMSCLSCESPRQPPEGYSLYLQLAEQFLGGVCYLPNGCLLEWIVRNQ